jgi:cell division protein FtsQ
VGFQGNAGGAEDVQDDRAGAGNGGERMQGGKGRRRFGVFLMGVLLVAVLVIALSANAWKRDLRVRVVEVEGNTIVPSAEILNLAEIPKNIRLVDVDIAGVRRRVQQNPFVRTVSVNREGPAGIMIDLEERVPLAALAAEQLLYIDDEGYVLPAMKSEQMFDLPVLTGALPPADCKPGRRITKPAVMEALDLLLLSREVGEELYRGISEIAIREDGDLVVYTSDSGVPVMVGRGDLPMKLAKFDGFWREIVSRRGPQQLQYVDLRFEDQVVARWNGSSAQQ